MKNNLKQVIKELERLILLKEETIKELERQIQHLKNQPPTIVPQFPTQPFIPNQPAVSPHNPLITHPFNPLQNPYILTFQQGNNSNVVDLNTCSRV
jgi:hypothetical protein